MEKPLESFHFPYYEILWWYVLWWVYFYQFLLNSQWIDFLSSNSGASLKVNFWNYFFVDLFSFLSWSPVIQILELWPESFIFCITLVVCLFFFLTDLINLLCPPQCYLVFLFLLSFFIIWELFNCLSVSQSRGLF